MKSIYRPFFNWYTFSGSYLNLRFAVLLFAAEVLIGTMGFVYIEQYDWLEAFYMTIITVSTVGYTEVQELSDDGRLFTSILILVNIAIFAYIVSAVTSFLVKGEFFRKMHINVIDRKISELEQHIILCGYGRYGKEVAEQFLKHDVEFVLIEKNHDRVVDIQRSPEKLLYIEGDATNDDVLVKAGIDRAKALLTTLSDDTSNVFTVLSARQMNPALNIISRASSPQSGKKLELAGSNQVIMPDQIGGFYMATMVNKPGTVEFLDR
ncbi:MAG: NAD-binding protein, partial [Bacteroidota bacterium]